MSALPVRGSRSPCIHPFSHCDAPCLFVSSRRRRRPPQVRLLSSPDQTCQTRPARSTLRGLCSLCMYQPPGLLPLPVPLQTPHRTVVAFPRQAALRQSRCRSRSIPISYSPLSRNRWVVMLCADRCASDPLCFARLTASAMPRRTRRHRVQAAPWSPASSQSSSVCPNARC